MLEGPGGVPIKDFTYDDIAPWPLSADGLGRSLVLIAPRTNPDPNDPFNWRPSTVNGGNPGTTDALPAPANPLGDSDDNGWPDLVDYAVTMPTTTNGFDATWNGAVFGAITAVKTGLGQMTWTNANSFCVGSADIACTGGNPQQRYFIEQMSLNNQLLGSSRVVGGRASTTCNKVNTYLITARGQSARGATKFVQSYYSVTSCPAT